MEKSADIASFTEQCDRRADGALILSRYPTLCLSLSLCPSLLCRNAYACIAYRFLFIFIGIYSEKWETIFRRSMIIIIRRRGRCRRCCHRWRFDRGVYVSACRVKAMFACWHGRYVCQTDDSIYAEYTHTHCLRVIFGMMMYCEFIADGMPCDEKGGDFK